MKFFIGLIIGIGIAGAVAFYLNKAQNPFVNKGLSGYNPSAPSKDNSGPLILAPGTKMQQLAPGAANSEDVAAANKPTASPPTYDFYDVLQGRKNINPKNVSSAPQNKPHGFIIQVGAFANQDLANDIKARLALLGYVAKIRAQAEDGKVINKVLLGPFNDADKAQSLVQELQQQDINATVINLNP